MDRSEFKSYARKEGFSVQVSTETEVSNVIIQAQRFLFSFLTPDTCILNRKEERLLKPPQGAAQSLVLRASLCMIYDCRLEIAD
jgi:hypothetical protein